MKPVTTLLDCGLLIQGEPGSSLSLRLDQTLDCGQCFTFSQTETDTCLPDIEQTWHGWAKGHALRISQLQDGSLLLHQPQDYPLWEEYFDLTTDYDAIRRTLSLDPTLAHAITFAPGIRILRQDPWEALCCFIISQNNNIKRIKGIVQRLCSCLGEPIPSSDCFSFPSPQRLAAATLEELEPLRCGFRAKYLLDAARRVSSGQVQLDAIPQMPLEQARAHLMQIVGVGPKVADCALLYGFHRLECCPMDVWMKRVFAALYPNGLPDCAQDFIGIAQQYLFHYARCCPQILETPEKEAALV